MRSCVPGSRIRGRTLISETTRPRWTRRPALLSRNMIALRGGVDHWPPRGAGTSRDSDPKRWSEGFPRPAVACRLANNRGSLGIETIWADSTSIGDIAGPAVRNASMRLSICCTLGQRSAHPSFELIDFVTSNLCLYARDHSALRRR